MFEKLHSHISSFAVNYYCSPGSVKQSVTRGTRWKYLMHRALKKTETEAADLCSGPCRQASTHYSDTFHPASHRHRRNPPLRVCGKHCQIKRHVKSHHRPTGRETTGEGQERTNESKHCIRLGDVQEQWVIAFGPQQQFKGPHIHVMSARPLLSSPSARSYSSNLRTSQKEAKLVGRLIPRIRLLWLGQVGLCLARA